MPSATSVDSAPVGPKARTRFVLVRWLPLLTVLGFLVAMSFAWRDRWAWNFDIVGYVAAAESWRHEEPEAMHRAVAERLLAGTPPEKLPQIAGGSRYRVIVATRAECLATQLPFYTVKPGYVFAGLALEALGFPLVEAFFWISLAAYWAVTLVAYTWLRSAASPWLACIAACSIAASAPLRLSATFATPDLLSCAFVVAGLWLLLGASRPKLSLGFLIGAVLIRPDNLLLLGLVAAWSALFAPTGPRIGKLTAALAVGAGTAIYLGTRQLTNAYSWGTYAKHTLVRRLYEPGDMRETISFPEYRASLWDALQGTFAYYPVSLGIFALLTVVLWSLEGAQYDKPVRSPRVQIAALLWIFVIGVFFVMPVLSDRMLLRSYVPTMVLVVTASAEALGKRRAAARSAS